MAKVYDVPQQEFISRLTEILKNEDIPAPVWSSFVKTGSHADKPPQQPDWWYTRCASIMRKIYLHGPLTVNDLRTIYGDGKRKMYYGARHHRDASGAIIRNAIHGLPGWVAYARRQRCQRGENSVVKRMCLHYYARPKISAAVSTSRLE